MKKRIVLLVFLALLLNSCRKNDNGPIDTLNQNPKLLFSSGFESNTVLSDPASSEEITKYSDYKILKGTDNSTGFSWPINILGSDFGGLHYIDDDFGFAVESKIATLSGRDGQETSALYQRLNYDIGVTQLPYQINNIKENPKELYMSYWMKTDSTSVDGNHSWRALWEYKTKNYNDTTDEGFRMISFMATDDTGRPHWLFQGDLNPLKPIWQKRNYSVPLVRNEWFKVEYYIIWSDGQDGYASMKVNGQLIAEHNGPTTANSDSMDFILLTQIYGNTYPMYQYIDDIEIWNGLPRPEMQ